MARAYVVRIDLPDGGCASGILLGEDRLILTNYHVVEGTDSLVVTTDDGTIAEARVLTFDVDRDLALLQAQSTIPEPPPVVWADDAAMSVGEQLVVIGYPFPGSSSPDDCSETITTTGGLLSGRLEILGQPYLQTDAALNPGVSGGLAISDRGEITGIAVSGLDPQFAESVGFLIPASEVVGLLDVWIPQLAAGELENPASQERIVFQRNISNDRSLYSIDVDGRNLRFLTGGSGYTGTASWSPDGTQIVFASDRDGDLDIYVMNSDGGNVRQLTNTPGYDGTPAWSPDGDLIAFYSDRSDWLQIFTMSADGSALRRLTSAVYDELSPTWSPDGSQIAYTLHSEFGSAGKRDIMVINTDGTATAIVESNDFLTYGPDDDTDPAWSPDGTQIAFARGTRESPFLGAHEIYVMDSDGRNVRALTDGPGDKRGPSWSPDGTRIAFSSVLDGDGSIFIMDADGGNVVRITQAEGMDNLPAWSPVLQPLLPARESLTPAPTPTPAIPPQLLAWLDVWEEFNLLKIESTRRTNEIEDTRRASDLEPYSVIDEWRDLEDWYRGDEGPYGFVLAGKFPRFAEVRAINDRISLYVEAQLQAQDLYIRHLETGDRALYDQSDALRIQNNHEWRQIIDLVVDLKADFGL